MAANAWRNALASAILLSVAPAVAAQTPAWTVVPSIGVRGTYTDNVSFAADPERGEFVTEVTPGISIAGRTGRFTGSLSYAASALFYARESDNNRIANSLNGLGNLEVVDNFFYVEALARISQTYLSPFGGRPADIFTVTDNRTETRTLGVSPYARGQLLGDYSYEVRNRNTWTSADNAAVSGVHTREWIASLASPIALFGWSVNGSTRTTSRDDAAAGEDEESSIVRAQLWLQPDAELRLFVSAGHEQNNFAGGEERSKDTYGYGALWRPTPRTSAEYTWEQRFFGTSRKIRFDHRRRLSAWSLAYTKDISDFQQELLQTGIGDTRLLLDAIFRARIPDPAQRAAAVEEFIRATGIPGFFTVSSVFLTEQTFLQERLTGSLGLLGARNSLVFTAFRARSSTLAQTQSVITPDFILTGTTEVDQRGFGLSASHRLTPFTSINARANLTFAEARDSGVETRNDSFSLGLSHTLSPKTTTFAGASYNRFESDIDATRYARSVFAGFFHRF